MHSILLLTLIGALGWPSLFIQNRNALAPNGPGADAHWPTAAKEGFGTSNTIASKVWFTLTNGVMSEVFYPTIDVPNVEILQLVVASASNIETEAEDTTHRIEIVDSRALVFRQINTAKNNSYTITKTYVTDPHRNTVLIDIEIVGRNESQVYVYYDPSLNNSGLHDSAWNVDDALLAVDGDKASALISSSGFALRDSRDHEMLVTSGFLETSDGLTELKRRRSFTHYARAENGNVVQVAALRRLGRRKSGRVVRLHCTLALGFGGNPDEALRNARTSLAQGFARVRREYEASWHKYVAELPKVGSKYQEQFNMSAMVLKGLEDKTYRGAIIASPSTPWGGGPNANEPTVSGYHAVWSRDLYHVATALNALGDKTTANRALDYLFNIQQLKDGSFPQNSAVDGRPIGGGIQMDQVALPIVLAYQLGRVDKQSWLRHIKPAADFIVETGPTTAQDRWEEKPGYSPATIAAEIAGLVCAARIAEMHLEPASADRYLKKADEWAAQVEKWTATSNGPYADGRYYLRLTERGNPDAGVPLEINSGGGRYDQREIVDAGFLELVRLGVKAKDNPLILRSLSVIDDQIRIATPFGPGWYRYNHDAYGERVDGGSYDGRTGKGRLWTFLSGERGEYESSRGNFREALRLLDAMLGFANDGLMIPEQVWDKNGPLMKLGKGTGSATPLAWSMAEFIRLALRIQTRRDTTTPAVVLQRYATRER